jgi:hypothetical protein
VIIIKLPLINELGQDKGSLVRSLKRRPKYLPRIGETIYLLPKVSPKVEKVNYSGLFWQHITITLEPVSTSLKSEIEGLAYAKGHDRWEVSLSRFDYENEA